MSEGGALREMLLHLGVEVDTHKLEHFDKGLTGVIERMRGVAAGLATMFAVHEFKEFLTSTIEETGALVDLSEKLGLSVEEIQKFQFAAKLGGVSAESAAGTLGKLNKALGAAASGGGEAEDNFKKFGIEIKKKDGTLRGTGDIVLDFADKIKEMKSQPERAAAAMKIFGRQGAALLPMLQEGKEEIENLYKEFEHLGGVLDKDFLKAAKKADDEMTKMHVAMKGLRVRAVAAFVPEVVKIIKVFERLAVVGQHVVGQTNALRHAFDFIKIVTAAAAIWKIVGALRALSAGLSLNPFTLIVVGALALFLILDDLFTMMEGGKSVIGDMLGPDKAAVVDSLRGSFEELKNTWREMWPDLKELGKSLFEIAIMTLPLFLKSVSLTVSLLSALLKVVVAIVGAVTDMVASFKAAASGDGFGALNKLLGAGARFGDAATSIAGQVTGNNKDQLQQATPQIFKGGNYGPYGPFQPGIATGGPGHLQVPMTTIVGQKPQQNVNVTQQFHNQIDVHTGSTEDPKAAGVAVGQGVQTQLQKELGKTINSVKTK